MASSLRLVSLAVCAVLNGCAVGPDFVRPPAPAVRHYQSHPLVQSAEAHGTAQHFIDGAAVAPDWWRSFNSPGLNALVTEALAHNPGVDAAQASLRQSEDNLRSGYGIFYPQAQAGMAARRQRRSAVTAGVDLPPGIFNLFTLSASVSYALDVFGGERRLIEGLHAQVDVQQATARATYLTLEANIVNAVIARAGYRAQIDATQQLIDLAAEQVRLTQVRVDAGMAPYSDLLSLQSQLAQYQASIPQLEQKVAQSNDLLATLAGVTPAEWTGVDISLTQLTLPSQLPVSLPAEMVGQRPDIGATEAMLHLASANIGVTTAAMLPSVTLSGGYSANSNSTATLLAAAGREWTAGADLAVPLFQGGTLWYRRRAAIDSYEQARAQYHQTVLNAFAQVADVLGALEHDAAALRAQDASLNAAQDALHLVQINYESGRNTYLDVLSANGQYQQALVNELQAVALRLQDSVALYVALGGGWSQQTP